MLKVCAHWDCKIGASFTLKRQIYQYYDFTAKSFGVNDLLLVDRDSTCTICAPNIFGTLEEVLDKFKHVTPVYISEKAKVDLENFGHPKDALYIVGPNYTGYDVPEEALGVRMDVEKKVPLWAHVALGIVLMDRVHKLR